jgi:hypothetical protein
MSELEPPVVTASHRPPLALSPLLLALSAILLQLLFSVQTFAAGGVALGLTAGIAAIIAGHVSISRVRGGRLRGPRLARVGLTLGYFSLVTIPVLGYGIIALYGGICGRGLLSK